MVRFQPLSQPIQLTQRNVDDRHWGKPVSGPLQNLTVTEEVQQGQQTLARWHGQGLHQRSQRSGILARKGLDDVLQQQRLYMNPSQQTSKDASICQVDDGLVSAGLGEYLQSQVLDLQVGLGSCVPEDFGPKLQRLTRTARPRLLRMQHRAAIAQPGDALPIQQVGIDSGSLRRGVGSQAKHPPAELVHKLEDLQVQFAPRTREQGLEVLEQRRYHQFKTAPGGLIDQTPA